MFFGGYNARKDRARRAADVKFARTPESTERGRYIVESTRALFQCIRTVITRSQGAQPKPPPERRRRRFRKMAWSARRAEHHAESGTGAGSWTEAVGARRCEGIGHDGRRLFPVMPYEISANVG